MDPFEVLRTTRAMRRLRPDPIPDDVVARILDAGTRAPSPGTAQAWRFVAVTDRATMARMGRLWRTARQALMAERPGLYASEVQARSSGYLHDHFDEVPLLVLGYGPPATSATTVVPALWSMCLAARAEGVGSTFTTLLTRVAGEVDEVVGVPADAGVALVGALPMGYPLGRWGVAPRQPLTDVVFADRWGQPPSWPAPA